MRAAAILKTLATLLKHSGGGVRHEVLLAKVDERSVGNDSKVGPIVDDEPRPVGEGHIRRCLNEQQRQPVRGFFRSNLNERASCNHRLCEHCFDIVHRRMLRRGDHWIESARNCPVAWQQTGTCCCRDGVGDHRFHRHTAADALHGSGERENERSRFVEVPLGSLRVVAKMKLGKVVDTIGDFDEFDHVVGGGEGLKVGAVPLCFAAVRCSRLRRLRFGQRADHRRDARGDVLSESVKSDVAVLHHIMKKCGGIRFLGEVEGQGIIERAKEPGDGTRVVDVRRPVSTALAFMRLGRQPIRVVNKL